MQRKFYSQGQKTQLRKQTSEFFASESGQKILEFLNFTFVDSCDANTLNTNETFYRLGRASTIKELNVWVNNFINKKEKNGNKN